MNNMKIRKGIYDIPGQNDGLSLFPREVHFPQK